MLILSFHPYNHWFLAFFALVPMLIAQGHILPVRWSGLASAVGIGGWLLVFLTAMFGAHQAGRLIQIVVLIIVLIQVFTEPGLRRFHQQTQYRWYLLQGTLSWVGIEMIRSFIPPINTHAFLAQTMYTQPWMLQPISIFGIYGLGIVLVLVNYAAAQIFLAGLDRISTLEGKPVLSGASPRLGGMAAGAVLTSWIAISVLILRAAPQDPDLIRAAAVQHNYPRPGHQDSAESQPARLEALSEGAREAANQGAELIVTPELGIGFDPQVEYAAEIRELANDLAAYLVIGYGLDDPRGWRNEALLLTPGGEFLEVYGKNRPTSPGEPPIITAGSYPVYPTSLGKLGIMICNDVNFTGPARKLVRGGAQLIALPTLEGPGITLEGVAQSVLRAVENRVAIVKADAAYASALIDPYGRIITLQNGSPQGEAFFLVADVPLGSGPTLSTRLGDWIGWLSLAGFLFFIIFQNIGSRKYSQLN